MHRESPKISAESGPRQEDVVRLLRDRLEKRGVSKKVTINTETGTDGFWQVRIKEVRAQEIREGTVKMSRKEAQCDADIVFRSSTISYNPKALSDNRLYVSMNSEKRARHKDGGHGGHGTHDIINATWMTGGTVDLQYIADEYDIDTAVSKSIEWICDGWSAVSDDMKKFLSPDSEVKFARKL
jgi:hypothetical protein